MWYQPTPTPLMSPIGSDSENSCDDWWRSVFTGIDGPMGRSTAIRVVDVGTDDSASICTMSSTFSRKALPASANSCMSCPSIARRQSAARRTSIGVARPASNGAIRLDQRGENDEQDHRNPSSVEATMNRECTGSRSLSGSVADTVSR